jgi:hypothetical protein
MVKYVKAAFSFLNYPYYISNLIKNLTVNIQIKGHGVMKLIWIYKPLYLAEV